MSAMRCLFLVVLGLALVYKTQGIRNSTEILRRISRFANSMVRPLDWTDSPTVVNVSIFIMSFHAVNEKTMDFAMDMYYRRMWNDPRLQYTDGPDHVTINPEGATKWFWLPDLFFPNSRDVNTHSILKPNLGAIVKPNGDVRLSAKVTAVMHCPMDLYHFPLDVQTCSLKVESYMHKAEHIDIRWEDVTVTQDINPPAFFLLHVEKSRTKTKANLGNYQGLEVKFRLRRLSGHYLLTTFLPSGCVVLLSCLVYWLPLSALSERTFFSVFLYLSMTVIMAFSQMATPQVGYAKAIDIWVVSCLLFIFFNVLEVIVLYLLARSAGYPSRLDQFELMKNVDANKPEEGASPEPGAALLSVNLVRRVDWVLRIVYPSAFILFNIIFWSSFAN